MAGVAHCATCDKPYADRTGKDACPRCGTENASASAERAARAKSERHERMKEELRKRTDLERAAAQVFPDPPRAPVAPPPPPVPSVAAPAPVVAPVAAPPPPTPQECPNCFEIAHPKAKVCKWCGYSFAHKLPHPALWEIGTALIALGVLACLPVLMISALAGSLAIWVTGPVIGAVVLVGVALTYASK